MPYFIVDNFNVGENGELVRKTLEAKPKTEEARTAAPPKLSLLQRAEQRHKAKDVRFTILKPIQTYIYTLY